MSEESSESVTPKREGRHPGTPTRGSTVADKTQQAPSGHPGVNLHTLDSKSYRKRFRSARDFWEIMMGKSPSPVPTSASTQASHDDPNYLDALTQENTNGPENLDATAQEIPPPPPLPPPPPPPLPPPPFPPRSYSKSRISPSPPAAPQNMSHLPRVPPHYHCPLCHKPPRPPAAFIPRPLPTSAPPCPDRLSSLSPTFIPRLPRPPSPTAASPCPASPSSYPPPPPDFSDRAPPCRVPNTTIGPSRTTSDYPGGEYMNDEEDWDAEEMEEGEVGYSEQAEPISITVQSLLPELRDSYCPSCKPMVIIIKPCRR